MSSELDEVARALFNGQIPSIWRKLAPDTLKSLGNWMIHFKRRYEQYGSWVRHASSVSFYTSLQFINSRSSIYQERIILHVFVVWIFCARLSRWMKESPTSCGFQDSTSQSPTSQPWSRPRAGGTAGLWIAPRSTRRSPSTAVKRRSATDLDRVRLGPP